MDDITDDFIRCLPVTSPSSLQNPPHCQILMNKMNLYLNQGQLCDVILIVGALRIPAHRVVLSAASDYFAAMFMSDLREAQEMEIEMKDIDPEALQSLVSYMYSG